MLGTAISSHKNLDSRFQAARIALSSPPSTNSQKKELKMADYYGVNIIIVGVISWTTLFLLIRKLLPNRSFDFCNRLVSTTHATLAVILASLSVDDWSCPVSPSASPITPKQMQTLGVTLGYTIYDLICSQFGENSKLDDTIHHLVCIVGLGAAFAHQKSGTELVAALFLAEVSTPFLHLRELLKELGYNNTPLNLAADIIFAVMFTIARMVGGPYVTYVTQSANNPLLIKVMSLGLQLVSTFWFYKILRMLKYKLTKRTVVKKFA